ncbi:MAG: PEP-CTERM sorting domain-containing protein [Desmonostoc vinosum HA7617-LM4]|nr:PEP-CTERM sorting domain-containing protein [Desmonostoc vinosum HA7617-LM4]
MDWKLDVATAINNQGQIVGNAINPDGQIHGFLLTPRSAEPVPEPLTTGGTLLAGMGLAYLRYQKRRLGKSI